MLVKYSSGRFLSMIPLKGKLTGKFHFMSTIFLPVDSLTSNTAEMHLYNLFKVITIGLVVNRFLKLDDLRWIFKKSYFSSDLYFIVL